MQRFCNMPPGKDNLQYCNIIVYFNTVMPGDSYMRQWTRPSLVQVMLGHPLAIARTMLIYCQGDPGTIFNDSLLKHKEVLSR